MKNAFIQKLIAALHNPPARELFEFYNSLTEYEKMKLREAGDMEGEVRKIKISRMSISELCDIVETGLRRRSYCLG